MEFTDRVIELGALAGCERPGVVLVEGGAGVGKTALVERLLAGEKRVWRASGERLEQALAGGVVDQWARRGAPRELILDGGVLFLDGARWGGAEAPRAGGEAESRAAVVYGARRSSGGLFVVAARPGAGALESIARLASVRVWLEPPTAVGGPPLGSLSEPG